MPADDLPQTLGKCLQLVEYAQVKLIQRYIIGNDRISRAVRRARTTSIRTSPFPGTSAAGSTVVTTRSARAAAIVIASRALPTRSLVVSARLP
jgi:hypothetical protein